jgi:hypothetical protein
MVINGRTVTVRTEVCNPHLLREDVVFLPGTDVERAFAAASEAQQSLCENRFLRSMHHDEVTVYMGHSRYGAGPDFRPPRLRGGVIDHEYYRSPAGRAAGGLTRFLSAEALRPGPGDALPAQKQLYLLGCSSEEHFHEALSGAARGAGYRYSTFDFVGTSRPSYLDGYEAVRLVEALGSGECGRDFRRTLTNINSIERRVTTTAIEVPHNLPIDTSPLFNSSCTAATARAPRPTPTTSAAPTAAAEEVVPVPAAAAAAVEAVEE